MFGGKEEARNAPIQEMVGSAALVTMRIRVGKVAIDGGEEMEGAKSESDGEGE